MAGTLPGQSSTNNNLENGGEPYKIQAKDTDSCLCHGISPFYVLVLTLCGLLYLLIGGGIGIYLGKKCEYWQYIICYFVVLHIVLLPIDWSGTVRESSQRKCQVLKPDGQHAYESSRIHFSPGLTVPEPQVYLSDTWSTGFFRQVGSGLAQGLSSMIMMIATMKNSIIIFFATII